MKISKKQKQEIEFLINHFVNGDNPTEQDKIDYISKTVHGESVKDNPLMVAKWNLDIMIEAWRVDLVRGLISKEELIDDFNCEFFSRLIKTIIKGITPKYRRQLLENTGYNALMITNFEFM